MNLYLKYIPLFFVLSIAHLGCFAQRQDTTVYVIDEAVYKRIAKNVAEQFYPGDFPEQANIEVPIENAFKAYRKEKTVRYEWKADTLLILEDTKNHLDSIYRRLKQDKDVSHAKLPKTLKELRVYKTKVDSAILAIRTIADDKREEIRLLSGQLDEKLNAAREQEKQIRAKEKADNKKKEKIQKISDKLEQESAELDTLLLSCQNSKSLLQIDKRRINNAVKSFAEHENLLMILSSEMHIAMQKKAELLQGYLNLIGTMEMAIEQMAGRFSNDRNKELMRSIYVQRDSIMIIYVQRDSIKPISEEQNSEINSICDALNDELSAYEHFCKVLDDLKEEYYCIVDNEDRKKIQNAKFFERHIQSFSKGMTDKTPYNKYYVLLNQKINELQDNLAVDSKSLSDESVDTQEEFVNYLKEFKSQIKL